MTVSCLIVIYQLSILMPSFALLTLHLFDFVSLAKISRYITSVEDNTLVIVAYKLERRSTLDDAIIVVSSSQACS